MQLKSALQTRNREVLHKLPGIRKWTLRLKVATCGQEEQRQILKLSYIRRMEQRASIVSKVRQDVPSQQQVGNVKGMPLYSSFILIILP
jgi:hypothetical protein